MAWLRRRAFVMIAQKLGAEHTITKMMGCMSYGRNNAEQGPTSNLQGAIREVSFLDGCFWVLNLWARDNDDNAQKVMLELYPRGYTSKP